MRPIDMICEPGDDVRDDRYGEVGDDRRVQRADFALRQPVVDRVPHDEWSSHHGDGPHHDEQPGDDHGPSVGAQHVAHSSQQTARLVPIEAILLRDGTSTPHLSAPPTAVAQRSSSPAASTAR